MIRCVPGVLSVTVVAALLAPAPAEAQIYQVQRGEARNAIGFNLGYFALRGEDARDADDVMLANLPTLLFEVGDFNRASLGGEWVAGVTEYLEAGVGIGFYRRTVPSVYRDFVDTDGTEIAQDLRLRVVPITATVRFLPVGRGAAVEPYVGAGIGIFNWRYSEAGEFVDFSDFTIFRNRYVANGNAVGPVVLGGVRFPVGALWTLGGEIRWQSAKGDTDPVESGLLGDKIDLGGVTYSFTMHFRF